MQVGSGENLWITLISSKMTEEDTFNRLRRIPFLKMFDIWAASPMTASTEGFRELFKEHGWVWEDYIEVHYREFGNDRE